jgi:IS605 OrfB family transposase
MKLVAKIRLNANAEQAKLLLRTLETANECANWMSHEAWENKVFTPFSLHKLLYHDARERFPLSSQIVVRLFSKVCDAYKLDKKVERRFAKHGAISYDSRILSYGENRVSIWTLDGREPIPYSAGPRQKELLIKQQGESDLIYSRGKWYLAATCDITDPPQEVVDEWLGVDLGVVQIATDSDGQSFSGSTVKGVRYRHRKLRSKLQAAQSKSAKRHLKKLSGKESRFAANVNHCIAKQIVEKAKRTKRGISIEDLTGIRTRIRARRPQRAVLHSWAFAQLGEFMTYKAVLAGVPLVKVDPRNSSRECSECGHIEKSNRPSQSKFRCRSCGYTANADVNAAVNLSRRASVNRPIVACV